MSLEPFTTLMASRHRKVLANPEKAQRALLKLILASSRGSPAANALGLTGNESFEEFLDLPAQDYSFYQPLVERTFDGDRTTFGRDPVVAFGETSGTIGRPKLIPHTVASLGAIRRFTERLLLFQLLEGERYIPHFTKWLAVTASTKVRIDRGIPVGFISGLMYGIARKQRKGFILPTPRVAAIDDWSERICQSVAEALPQRVGTMLGVPAYLCRFLDEASAQAHGKPLGNVWPMLGRIYYSGTSVDPYRDQLERILGRSLIIRGLYTATEGSFGAELDPRFPGELHLMVDMNVFAFRDADKPRARLVAAWEVVRGRRYEVFVTTLAGLYQYRIGDLIEVTENQPLRIRVTGRSEEEINLATEKLSLKQAHAVIDRVAARVSIHRDHFIVMPDPGHPRRHLWIIVSPALEDESRVSTLVDAALAAINPSYAALRRGDAVLERPRTLVLAEGSFDRYIHTGFAARGQFKFRHIFKDAQAIIGTPGLETLATRLEE
ncbi:MAG: GH3 auxin-responsive promoter family protein [Gemmatimonadota bacterium]|nr:GH3 auxin-responsive promoter family protein [Gemmatimonadota bacterium]